MRRIRYKPNSKQTAWELVSPQGDIINSGQSFGSYEEMEDSNNQLLRPHSVVSHCRVRRKLSTSYKHPASGTATERFYQYGNTDDLRSLGEYVINNLGEFMQPPKMEFQRNNKFEILNFLGEIDETLATFSKKFLRSLTYRKIVNRRVQTVGISGSAYGAYTWGVRPLIADLFALRDSLSDIFSDRIKRQLAGSVDAVIAPVNKEFDYVDWGGYRYMGGVFGTIRLNGLFSVPDMTPFDYYAILLDELGFHPDLKTVWDLLPMSFVADYFLPIGDALESLHPRGWFKPTMSYTGRVSAKLTVSSYKSSIYNDRATVGTIVGKYFYRGSVQQSFPPQPEKRLKHIDDWKAPNMTELFNTAYVALSK